MIIAIDGPAGSGKSTVARTLAHELNFKHVNSGAIYRAVTLFGYRKYGSDLESHADKVASYLQKRPEVVCIKWEEGKQKEFLNGTDVSIDIRTTEITNMIHAVASHIPCREIVNAIIKNSTKGISIVIEGRDIGTVVFPNATIKFYLDASSKIRAERRALELGIKANSEEFNNLKREIEIRDDSDKNRLTAPLKKADDALYINTSPLSQDEVVLLLKQKSIRLLKQ